MTSILRKRDEQRAERREALRHCVLQRLRNALHELAPGQRILVFGSITRPYGFHEMSDVDLAFAEEPPVSRYGLQSRLEERIGRPVDLVVLSECRFRQKIEREGEPWTS